MLPLSLHTLLLDHVYFAPDLIRVCNPPRVLVHAYLV